MPSLPFTTVDVFTRTRYAGNPLAIVQLPLDHAITDAQMQTIAREFNLSETVFIRDREPESVPQWRLRIFMTEAELPFAGHPTIGAACFAMGSLAQEGERAGGKGRLVCNAGPVEVDFDAGMGVARAGIPVDFHRHVEHGFGIEGVLALQPGFREEGVRVKGVDVVSPVKGMNFIAVELGSLEDLGLVRTSGVKLKAQLDRGWDAGFCGSYFYVVTSSSAPEAPEGAGEVKVRTRMVEGTLEDPATGSAACGLCCFLAMNLGWGRRTRFEVVQGVEMGRRSEIGVEVVLKEGGKGVESVVLSGTAVKVMEGKVEV